MIRIGQRPIGPEHPVYLIAELSANHRQDISIALETIRAMADAGADAIKLQTYTALLHSLFPEEQRGRAHTCMIFTAKLKCPGTGMPN
jgi:sialic acid synthase SpsE